MRPPALYAAISGHGFGHAARTCAVLDLLRRKIPKIRLFVVCSLERWVFDSFLGGSFHYRKRGLDVGVIQSDSFHPNRAATLQALHEFERDAAHLIREEAKFIRENGIDLLLADIPSVAVDIARAADIPCYLQGNFGWNFIYRDFGADFLGPAEKIEEQYAGSDLLFRLPFHESMAIFPRRVDCGLVGRRARLKAHEVRRSLKLGDLPLVLIIFGGMGADGIPYRNVDRFHRAGERSRHFICFDPGAPVRPNLTVVNDPEILVADLLPVCERVITKPGYGIMADALLADQSLDCIRRTGFAEMPILERALRDFFVHNLISMEEFSRDGWEFLERPPAIVPRLPARTPSGRPALNGVEFVVGRIKAGLNLE